jgi:hypothetical protein
MMKGSVNAFVLPAVTPTGRDDRGPREGPKNKCLDYLTYSEPSWILGEEEMTLKEYFASVKGRGILATADREGRVDAAVYAAPHVMDDDTVAFIMRDRLTHHNLQSNPHAAYLFMEAGEGYAGKRLFLTKVREEQDSELLHKLRRRKYEDEKQEAKFLVFFRIDKVLPLIGAGKGNGAAEED